MKITILNPEEVKLLFKRHGEFASVCYDTDIKYAERVGKSCQDTNHMSGSRSRFIEVKIEGVSRAMIDQLARHEQGVVKNIQSQRYVLSDFEYTTPSAVANNDRLREIYDESMSFINTLRNTFLDAITEELGCTGEKANEIVRGLNPMNIHTKACFAFNPEALINLAHKRLCVCSQEEIRQFTRLLCDEVINLVPELEDKLVPVCEFQLWCPESKKRSCGRKPIKSELIKRLEASAN